MRPTDVLRVRLKHARHALRDRDLRISSAAFDAKYADELALMRRVEDALDAPTPHLPEGDVDGLAALFESLGLSTREIAAVQSWQSSRG